jgi:hypothetical protein
MQGPPQLSGLHIGCPLSIMGVHIGGPYWGSKMGVPIGAGAEVVNIIFFVILYHINIMAKKVILYHEYII